MTPVRIGRLAGARHDGQEVAARLRARRTRPRSGPAPSAESPRRTAPGRAPTAVPDMSRKLRNSSSLSRAVTTTRTLPSSTSVATVNLPWSVGRPHRPADHLGEELVVVLPAGPVGGPARPASRGEHGGLAQPVGPAGQDRGVVLVRRFGRQEGDFDQRVVLDRGQHEAADRRQRPVDPAEHLVGVVDLRLDHRLGRRPAAGPRGGPRAGRSAAAPWGC